MGSKPWNAGKVADKAHPESKHLNKKKISTILVSKEVSGRQQSHPLLRFGQKSWFKIRKFEKEELHYLLEMILMFLESVEHRECHRQAPAFFFVILLSSYYLIFSRPLLKPNKGVL